MADVEYLQRIKKGLLAGKNQYRKGASLLEAFGFVRRRHSSIEVIQKELKFLGLTSVPPIDDTMPLESPYIRFFLADKEIVTTPEKVPAQNAEEKEELEELPIVAFKVGELEAAAKEVTWIKPSDLLSKAYTIMCLNRFSQLVVAETKNPYAIHIKGTISYRSIANALINGGANTVNDCLDKETPQVNIDDDIGTVIRHLQEHDVVLVIGRDKRLSGIVTAWDLAAEFEGLVGPFKWIGEIETRVKTRLLKNIGTNDLLSFLAKVKAPASETSVDVLTLGSLIILAQNPENWKKLNLPFERETFCQELDKTRELRNRLMHFRDPLNPEEKTKLKRFCDVVRSIPE